MVAGYFDEIMLVAGLALLALGIRMRRRTREFVEQCRTTQGRVVAYTSEESDEGGLLPRNRFLSRPGRHRASGPGSSGLRKPPIIGTTVLITYDPWLIAWVVLAPGVAWAIGSFVVRASG